MVVIDIKDAKIGYDKNNILFDDFNVEIKKGDFISILGKTGIGKTTILKCIVGLNTIIQGKIKIDGSVSICFQDSRLFPHMNVYKNISYPLIIKKISKAEIDNKVDDILEQMGITNIKYRDVNELSGGEVKRVALSRALISNPDILLLDEPTTNLDFETKISIRELIKNIHKDNNCTIIMVTHDILDTLYLSDKILILDNKKIISFVNKKEIKNDKYAYEYLKPFFDEANKIKL